MSQEQDKAFFRNFSLIVGALAVLMVIFIFAARIIGFNEEAETKRKADAAAKLTAPVGEVSVTETAQQAAPAQEAAPTAQPAPEVAATGAAPAAASAQGKQVYDGLCVSCHGSGIPGIPQKGDKTAWAPRIAQGKDTLYQHALQGFTGKSGMMMPPKGGGTNTDDEVKAAVDYMVSNSQ
jgi:cytochrome c5